MQCSGPERWHGIRAGRSIMISEITLRDGTSGLELSNGSTTIAVARSYGPRIVHYSAADGFDLLGEAPGAEVNTVLGVWKGRGGHRLWHAPERIPRTYVPDNDPVEWEEDGPLALSCVLTEGATGIVKRMRVELAPRGTRVTVHHELGNVGLWPIEVAPWALTIMRPGGEVVIPSEPFQTHAENLLPVRTLAVWGYTDLSDERLTFDRETIRIKTASDFFAPFKLGLANRRGWAAYEVAGHRFRKSFPYLDGVRYPDMGCNCEVFTSGDFLELETLGPFAILDQGDTTEHVEIWEIEGGDVRDLGT